jgi:glycosyltransferase involved in cell wall biosynthesis
MSVTAAFLVKDPPIDRLALLVDYIRPVVREFVFVIDDRTQPDTIRKIESWPDVKTVMYEWNDDFAAARNAALPLVTSKWVLHLDPDELPSAIMLGHIDWVAKGNVDPETMGILYWTVNYWGGEKGEEMPYHWHCRLFRAGHGRWYRRVHELVELDGQTEDQTRRTIIMPEAPKAAYLIHSKPEDRLIVDQDYYEQLGERSL